MPSETSTLGSHLHPADMCRVNGWTAGTRLVGDEGYGPTVIEITAVGRGAILAATVSYDGKLARYYDEAPWRLDLREWTVVA